MAEESKDFIDKGSHYVLGKFVYSKCHKVPVVNISGVLCCGDWQCQMPLKNDSLQAKAKRKDEAKKAEMPHGEARWDEKGKDAYAPAELPEFPAEPSETEEDVPF